MNSWALTSLVLTAFSPLASAQTAPPSSPELVLDGVLFARDAHELSGLAQAKEGHWAVADAQDDHYIYLLKTSSGVKRYSFDLPVDLSTFKGFPDITAAAQAETRIPPKDRRLDLEGLALCGDTAYLVSERVRQILVADLKTSTIVKAPVNFGYADLFAGEANAGFEGIAADCAKRVLYIAKERDPRRILIVEAASWTMIGEFDVPPSGRNDLKHKTFTDRDGKTHSIAADFADLAFDGGFLYALERNSFEVAKIDPKTFAVVGRVSYLKTEEGLYDTGEPFGIAEALVLSSGQITIGLDNNGSHLSQAAQQKYRVSDHPQDKKVDGFGAILVFKRPAGF